VGGDDEERGRREGFAGYIEKPFLVEMPSSDVRRLLMLPREEGREDETSR
jgi:hypothetical protein